MLPCRGRAKLAEAKFAPSHYEAGFGAFLFSFLQVLAKRRGQIRTLMRADHPLLPPKFMGCRKDALPEALHSASSLKD